jgi:type III restriction enzyme
MALKLKFDSNLGFQKKAIDSVVNLFEGQPMEDSLFKKSFEKKSSELQEFAYTGNNLVLSYEDILDNLKNIQDSNDLEISKKLEGMDFSVEMETGTGKTYVYLRSIFEMNKKYGFKKFVIVVPSIAIKEGVLKSISMMKKHFQDLYNKTPFDHYVYDPKNINNISSFAKNNNIQILIINIDAFRKTVANVSDESKANIIHRRRDQLQGRKPIEYIQAVKPILIIDEPQSVDNTPKAQEAIKTLNPLCTLRYSATHRNVYNLTYSLNAIKAYDQRLVKKIQVTSVVEEITGSNAYAKLLSVDNKNGIKAKLKIHYLDKGVLKEKNIPVKDGSDLFELSNEHEVYKNGFIVRVIDCTPGGEYVEFVNGIRVQLKQEIGGSNDDVQKAQIQATIQQHLDTESRLLSEGIKVLSLFFIDKVANYRFYNEDNEASQGKFAQWFEEIFLELINKPCYAELKKKAYGNLESFGIEKIHDGYFAQDKKGKWKDTKGTTADDDSVYDKIMKNKEQLLSSAEPLRFIFSHSALKEGWDNPNVFQICTLNETKSAFKKRQEIGRGLRLPVNQKGERIKVEWINKLTVVANESYDQFCKTLQSEYEDDGIEFGKISTVVFKNLEHIKYGGNEKIGSEGSEELFKDLVERGYLNSEGHITDKFKPEDKEFVLEIDERFEKFRPKVVDILKSHMITSRIDNTKAKKEKKLNKEVYLSPEFKELWKRISGKTTYSVEYSTEDLIRNVLSKFRTLPKIKPAKIHIERASVDIKQKGIDGTLTRAETKDVETISYVPDVLSILDKELEFKITRHALSQMILKSDRLEELKINPQEFIRQIIRVIKAELNKLIVFGIKYEKIDNSFYEMRQFDELKVMDYLVNRAIESEKHVYNVVEYDSEVERNFAQVLNDREDIKLFVKLPSWFKIQTPLGTYNPDWAIVKQTEDTLYLVKETKGTLDYTQLRNSEDQKIHCGKKHFESLDSGVEFGVAVYGRQV